VKELQADAEDEIKKFAGTLLDAITVDAKWEAKNEETGK